jgi:hypothetical protein
LLVLSVIGPSTLLLRPDELTPMAEYYGFNQCPYVNLKG